MIQKVSYKKIGLPSIKVKSNIKKSYELFDLSSHERAKEALEFGLSIDMPEFNIFVVGENRSGRLSATLELVKKHLATLPPNSEWVYLNNFERPEEPLPFKFPAGQASLFSEILEQAINSFIKKYISTLRASYFSTKAQAANKRFKKFIEAEIENILSFSKKYNFDIHWGADGTITPVYLNEKEDPHLDKVDPKIWDKIIEKLQELDQKAEEKQLSFNKKLNAEKYTIAKNSLSPFLLKLKKKFQNIEGLTDWLESLEKDVLNNIQIFENDKPEILNQYLTRYTVNVLVDCQKDKHPPLIVEPNPNYESLFGQVMYEATQQGYHTDHRMIRPGSLHKANGGILILRAESIAEHPGSWGFLKAALRDREIRIEELHRMQSAPMLKAPKPKAIPLDVKIILIGAPMWYHLFFMNDPDFQTYFKIKAEIDESMDLTVKNTRIAASLLQRNCALYDKMDYAPEALAYLLAYSTRLTEDRQKLPSQFEKLQDVVSQATVVALQNKRKRLEVEDIKRVIQDIENRSRRPKDFTQELINEKVLHIETDGAAVGQVNSLTILSGSDVLYGSPVRITATTAMGSNGIVNIERQTKMGGPLQQKSVFIIEGFLQQRFAQDFPLCISSMLTFEQNYALVDGDSASLAEICAILSSLADLPIQQAIAITGSMNQFGQAQAVGGIPYKVEGFYDICKQNGLNGKQGVIIPKSNVKSLVLKDELVADIKAGKFNLWAVETVEDALSLLLDKKITTKDKLTDKKTVFGKIYTKLKRFAEYNKNKR